MVSRTTVELLDDVDGKVAAETVTFALDGREFEIDLTEKNAKALRKAFEPWTSSARRVGGRKARAATVVAAALDTKAVRAWAVDNGIEISTRGRISADVLEQYQAAGK
jgi:uncharacterized protein (DUF4415 family)